jgi:hypothetical protein
MNDDIEYILFKYRSKIDFFSKELELLINREDISKKKKAKLININLNKLTKFTNSFSFLMNVLPKENSEK